MTTQGFRTVLFKVFMTIFVATAVITLLGVTGAIQIKEGYLNTLFTALVVELVGAVIALFRSANFFGVPPSDMTSAPTHKLSYLSPRMTAIGGTWKGTANQVFSPDGQPFQAEVVITFDSTKPTITGNINFRFTRANGQQVDYKFEHAGGFLFDQFLRFEYNNIDPVRVQFGSIILELEPNSTELNGRYQGFGIESKKIIYGTMTLTKVV